jgi:hypothetical protein
MTTTPDRIWVTPRDEECNWIGDAYSAPDPDYDAPQIEYVRADLVQRDLRDWFAGKALSSMITDYRGIRGLDPKVLAKQAYGIADAMIDVRGER